MDLGLTDDEVAFYDALATNESAVRAMGDDKLRLIAAEVIMKVRDSVSIDLPSAKAPVPGSRSW